MLTINKLTSASPVDYAAEELKKYLRMMMPEGGDVKIAYAPDAKDGFRLGLMQELGLDVSDVEDAELDDVLYIETDTRGGIIAGSNPRSVLLAVYEYLRQNGCRWLMPGVDGEYIPIQDIKPVKYRHKPSMRYRGWCNEGTEFQQCMLDAIELAPKLGMNVFMLEFRIPSGYYSRYYNHDMNEARTPEPISTEQIIRWKVQCEAEIQKRGLQFHNIGHGFTIDPFKIPGTEQYQIKVDDSIIPEETKKYLAYVDGKRGFKKGSIINTNFCMSNPEARKIAVEDVVDYAKRHSNTDYLHVWLSDGQNSHCECEECCKMTPSDWYMVWMNEIDARLTEEGLSTRIVFIAYIDSTWAPEKIRINNPERFALLIAPITRTYTETLPKVPSTDIKLRPYVRNKLTFPASLEEYFLYFDEWKKVWQGPNITYEYHFWRQHFYEISGIILSKRVNEDVKVYRENGLSGIIEDGSQRAFFPTGLAFYTYARTLFDVNLTHEELAEDYFSHAFGKDWKLFYDYLMELAEAIDYKLMVRRNSSNPEISPYYNPAQVENLKRVPEIVAKGRRLIEEHFNSDIRVQTVATRLLSYHATFVEGLAKAMEYKVVGNDTAASDEFNGMMRALGAAEPYFERYFDFTQCQNGMRQIFYWSVSNLPQNETQDT